MSVPAVVAAGFRKTHIRSDSLGSGQAGAMVVASPAADVYAGHSPFWAVSRRSALRRLGLAWAGSAAGGAMAVGAVALIAYRAGGAGGGALVVAGAEEPGG